MTDQNEYVSDTWNALQLKLKMGTLKLFLNNSAKNMI